ncbi:MAG: GDYXXLXY domain-containing protein [Chitinophagaceae bacterium]
MKKGKGLIILLNLLVVLGFFLYAVKQKESILSEGKLILFELAPVDPRSLMQGDYMALRYKIVDSLINLNLPKRGFIIIRPDSFNIARYVRIQKGKEQPGPNEQLIEYKASSHDLNIGASAFFFEEGKADKYEKAKYGGIKVDQKGNSVLTGLYDQTRIRID